MNIKQSIKNLGYKIQKYIKENKEKQKLIQTVKQHIKEKYNYNDLQLNFLEKEVHKEIDKLQDKVENIQRRYNDLQEDYYDP